VSGIQVFSDLIYSERIRLIFGFFNAICEKQTGSYNYPWSQVVEIFYFWNYILGTKSVVRLFPEDPSACILLQSRLSCLLFFFFAILDKLLMVFLNLGRIDAH
jgi:hypothetical protein